MRLGAAAILVPVIGFSAATSAPGVPPARAARPAAAASFADTTQQDAARAADSARAVARPPASPHGHFSVPGGRGAPAARAFKIVVPRGAPRVRSVTLGIRHRVFHDFAETDEVRLRQPFAIGDTPYAATVTDFVPDFVIDVAARRISSRSSEPRNPAFRIIVREDGVPSDTAWAFLNLPPHFAPKSLLAFKVLRIDFADRPPLLADTSAAAKAKP